MVYADVYKNINKKVIHVSKEIAPLLWNGTDKEKFDNAYKWLHMVSEIYGINTPRLIFLKNDQLYNMSGGGLCIEEENIICIFNKFSFVTLAHEFRHAFQHQKQPNLYKNNHEEDARAWSLSLFKLACPERYQNAVEKGLLRIS